MWLPPEMLFSLPFIATDKIDTYSVGKILLLLIQSDSYFILEDNYETNIFLNQQNNIRIRNGLKKLGKNISTISPVKDFNDELNKYPSMDNYLANPHNNIIHFLLNLIRYDREKRYNVNEALAHLWLLDYNEGSVEHDSPDDEEFRIDIFSEGAFGVKPKSISASPTL